MTELNNIISKLSQQETSIDEVKKILGINGSFPTDISDQISNQVAKDFLSKQIDYDKASMVANHLFMGWMSDVKGFTDEFGEYSWVFYDAFDKADEEYDENNKLASIEKATKLLKESGYF